MAFDYDYSDTSHSHSHAYLLPAVDVALAKLAPNSVFDLGCGNGSVAKHLSGRYSVVEVVPEPPEGIDSSDVFPPLNGT